MDGLQQFQQKLLSLADTPEVFMRPAVQAVLPQVKSRIHVNGLKADGGRIGTYSNAYLKERQELYNRTDDPKMIWSLTRQMEMDFVAVADQNKYGLGFNNAWNFQKATWLDEMVPGVYQLSSYEQSIVEKVISEVISGFLE